MLEKALDIITSDFSYQKLSYVAGIVCVGLLIRWMLQPSTKLDLPTFDVTTDVVATLEKAHKQVSSIWNVNIYRD